MIPNSKSDADFNFTFNFVFWVCLISLIPFVLFFLFTTPCSDDIFYHNYAQGKTTWEFLAHHYNTWTGRYFSNWMMVINPYTQSSDPFVYPWMMLSLFVFFIGSLFLFFKSTSKALLIRGPTRFLSLFLTVFFTTLFFHRMPRTADSFYWFAGASSHLFPMCFVLLSTSAYFGILKSKHPSGLASVVAILFISLTSVLVSGSNETLAVQWLFTLCFVLFFQKVTYKEWDRPLLLPLLLALIGFAILYFAPGNSIRAKELHGGHDFGLLLIKPWGLVVETSVRFLSLSLLISIFIFCSKIKDAHAMVPNKWKEKQPRLLLNFYGLGFFVLTFVPSVWTMGGLPPRRVLNNTYLFFLIYGLFLLILNFDKLNFLERWSQKVHLRFPIKRFRLAFMVSLLFFFNHITAWDDLVHLPAFVDSLSERTMLVQSGQNTDLVVPPLKHFPSTFFYEDFTVKSDDYRNSVYSQFFKLKSVRLSQDYEN